ncbi:hypothetical protein GGR53DRAFT_471122 [Hypoxylon sp. FL1150]|nr:hypothetical protein GGR53DRAFT_471122 [Hypoxylon sp. FL1150]
MDRYRYAPGGSSIASGPPSYEIVGPSHSRVDSSAEGILRGPQSINDLITFMSLNAGQMEESVRQLAGYTFISHYPTTVQWELVRCAVETTRHGYYQMQPFKAVALEYLESAEKSSEGRSEDAYALCIRIKLPEDIDLRDEKVTRMKEYLAYDDTGEHRFIPGIPFRQHPIYKLFHIEFTKDTLQKNLTLTGDTIWNLSSAVFLPIPETICDRDSTRYLLHYTINDSEIELWKRQMDNWGNAKYGRSREERIMRGVRYVQNEGSEGNDAYERMSTRVRVRTYGGSDDGWEPDRYNRM